MSISMYDISIPVLTRGLTNLSAILDKGAAHAAAKKFDSAVLAQSRLFPDMHPLIRQVQFACDTAKGAAARLAGIEVPKKRTDKVDDPDKEELLWVATVLYDRAGEYAISHFIPRFILTEFQRKWPVADARKKWQLAYPRAKRPRHRIADRRDGRAAGRFANPKRR